MDFIIFLLKLGSACAIFMKAGKRRNNPELSIDSSILSSVDQGAGGLSFAIKNFNKLALLVTQRAAHYWWYERKSTI